MKMIRITLLLPVDHPERWTAGELAQQAKAVKHVVIRREKLEVDSASADIIDVPDPESK